MMSKNEPQLNPEENQFLERLGDRPLPEPDQAFRQVILSRAKAHLASEEASVSVRKLSSTDRHTHYRQLAVSVIAANVVVVMLGICLFSMSDKKSPTDSNKQMANAPVKESQTPKAVIEDALDPMAFDDTYGQLAVSSTKQKINSFWSNDASWQKSRSTTLVDQRLSMVRYRTEQLKKRSELDELFRSGPTKNEGGYLERLEPVRHVWVDVSRHLPDGDV